MFDPLSLMDVYLYVEEVIMISAHYILLDISRCSTTYSGSRDHQRDTTPLPSCESHLIHKFNIVLAIFNSHNGF